MAQGGSNDLRNVIHKRRRDIDTIKSSPELAVKVLNGENPQPIPTPIVETPPEVIKEVVEIIPVEESTGLIDDTHDEPAEDEPVPEIVQEEAVAPEPPIPEVPQLSTSLPDIFAEDDDIILESNIEEHDTVVVSKPEESVEVGSDPFDLDKIPDDDNVEISDSYEEPSKETNETETKKPSNPIKIGYQGGSKISKHIAAFVPSKNIKITAEEKYQQAVYDQYISGKGGFSGPRGVTRVILPYSGIFIDLNSYTNSEMLGIHRSSATLNFVDKISTELYSAYEHTINNSLGIKLEYDEWLRSIKYPDMWCIYWGIYSVNYPGLNEYHSDCDNLYRNPNPCRTDVTEKRDNGDISFISENSIEDITVEDIMSIKSGVERQFIKAYKVASTLIEKDEFLPESNIKVFYGMPNLEEVMTFIKYLKTDLNEEDDVIAKVLQPISWLSFAKDNINSATLSKIIAYKYNMFTRKLHVPVYESVQNTDVNGTTKLKATYVDVDPRMIPEIINKLSKEDFKVFVKSKPVSKLMVKDGIHFRVKNMVCPNCKKTQIDLSLDMRDILFTKAATLMDFLIDT